MKDLNNHVVKHLLADGINAVGISPCINIPSLCAHGGDEGGGATTFVASIREALHAGLIPVVHGDAGLYGSPYDLDTLSGGILGGDTLVEIISSHNLLHISTCIFLTDVDGVYTKDPKANPGDAKLMDRIDVDAVTGEIITENINASGSSHAHDVTGGLKVSFIEYIFYWYSVYLNKVQTKLKAAAAIAKNGTDVIIAKCASKTAERIMKNLGDDFPENLGGHTIVRSYMRES